MPRVSIRSLMAFIVVSAVGLAALRNADELSAGLMLLFTLAAVGAAVLGVILTRGRERAWWLGFAFFGVGYLALTVGPWVSHPFRLQLGTPHLIGHLRSVMFASDEQHLLVEKQQIDTELANLRAMTGKSGNDPVVVSLTRSSRAIQAQLTANRNARLRYDEFQRVGHCLVALLSGLVGGTIGVWFWGRRERGGAAESIGSPAA